MDYSSIKYSAESTVETHKRQTNKEFQQTKKAKRIAEKLLFSTTGTLCQSLSLSLGEPV